MVHAVVLLEEQRRAQKRSVTLLATSIIVLTAVLLRSQSLGPPVVTLPGEETDPTAAPPTSHTFTSTAQSSPAPDDTTCFQQFTWVEPALDGFFEPSRASAKESKQSSEESIEAMANITWLKGYHPGYDIMALRYDAKLKRYALDNSTRWRANQPYKQEGILMPLRAAIEAHGAALAAKFERRDIRFVVETEDFPMIYKDTGSKLPAFAMCTDSEHIDVPVPDFTFGGYPEAKYANPSWPAISELLATKSDMIPWTSRKDAIFHRSHWGVGPRQKIMPMLAQLAANGSDAQILGAKLNINDTGFFGSKPENFVWLDDQCTHKVSIHTAGFSYSAGLKYRLACGSMVILFDSKYKEFYEPALEDGKHVVRVPATHEGVDESEFFTKSAPKIKAAVEAAVAAKEAPAIAKAGQQFAEEQLSSEALSCYWYGALLRYGEMYFGGEVGSATKGGESQRRKLI